jgi:hypothetical protein
VIRLFQASLCTVRRAIERQTGKLPHESEAFDAMLDHALQSWGVTDPWLRRESRRRYRIFERDGWRCTVPGCTSQRNLHAFHHQRGVHAGTLRIGGRAPANLWFELGTREGRPPLVRYRSGDRVA